jgi:CRISPR-associated protein Csb2
LSNAVLTDQNGYPQAILRPISQPSRDSVIFQYIDSAETFQTVTPVILPGYDDMKYTKAQKLIEKALDQAGFSVDDLAEPIYLQKAPFRKGGYGPSSYAVPKYLRGKPGMHVQLKFKERIDGPIAIGAGRHFGLGLFAAVKT